MTKLGNRDILNCGLRPNYVTQCLLGVSRNCFIGLCTATLLFTRLAAQSNIEQQKDSLALQELDEVVVSDSRFSLKRENSGKTVVKITAETLEKSQGMSVAELINNVSGLEITGSRTRAGAVLGVFARGGRGRQVLILVDGVRVADPSSSSSEYDLRLLSTATIASIEILKGAASTLYGTNAATAVISITTKKAAQQGTTLQVQSSIATNQTAEDQNYNAADFSNSVQLQGKQGKFSYTTRFLQNYVDGMSALQTPKNEEDVFSRISTDMRLGYHFSDAFSFEIYGNHTKTASDFDESFGFLDANYQFLSTQERLGMASTYAYNKKGFVVLNGAYSSYFSESKSAFPNTFEGKNYVFDLYNKLQIGEHWHTILGLNYNLDSTEFMDEETFSIIDPYANVVYVSDFGLNMNIGARLNTHSEYGNHFVYNLNPSFTFTNENGYVKLMGSLATSYITPSLTQLYGDFGANADLEPEQNRTLEGGLEYATTGNFRFSALYFDRKEENFVFYDGGASAYLNAENIINAQGLELELFWQATKKMNVSLNYAFTERKGDNAIRIPKHKINAKLQYDWSHKLNMAISYAFTGDRADTDFASFPFRDVSLQAFSTTDIYLGYKIIPNTLRLFVNANNLFNTSYTEVLGFSTKGRNIRLGVVLNL